MEIQADVRLPKGSFLHPGVMKRHTTPVCPGRSMYPEGRGRPSTRLISRVNRDIGRQGCQYFAEILVECGLVSDQLMAHDLGETLKAQPSASLGDYSFLRRAIRGLGSCLARPKG
jgi:hypothetical protein